jgi:FMN phosphatase YigB (HAD superfamily)
VSASLVTVENVNNVGNSRPGLLVTDLDNTLWDWFAAWHASFSAMLERLIEISGVPAEVLEPQIRAVHQARGTAEYSFLLDEVPALVEASGSVPPSKRYDDALHQLHSRRRATTRLYPGVLEALTSLKQAGIAIAAYTESLAYWTEWRIRWTSLDGLIDRLYSAPDHDLPNGVSREQIRTKAGDEYGLKHTKHLPLPRGVMKPNAEILRSILSDCGVQPDQVVYVGDSLMKDIAMAQSVGVLDVHAKYGEAHQKAEYELLRRVTHWTDKDVQREKELSRRPEVHPTITLQQGFPELLPVFGLERLPA